MRWALKHIIRHLARFSGCLPYKIPRYYEDEEIALEGSPSEERKESSAAKNGSCRIYYWKSVLLCLSFFYMLSCGIERIFQSMVHKALVFIVLIYTHTERQTIIILFLFSSPP